MMDLLSVLGPYVLLSAGVCSQHKGYLLLFPGGEH